MDDDDGADAVPGDPMAEFGEELAVPADWATRKPYLETEFELFERDNLRFYHHVNGLFLLFVGRQHPVLSHPLAHTARVSFTEATRKIRGVTGKKRKGAPRTDPVTVIGKVTVEDGTSWNVAAGIKGFVVEINEKMEPGKLLLLDDPSTFMAVLQPKSDFVSRASFVPGMIEEARERRAKKQLKRDEQQQQQQQQQQQ